MLTDDPDSILFLEMTQAPREMVNGALGRRINLGIRYRAQSSRGSSVDDHTAPLFPRLPLPNRQLSSAEIGLIGVSGLFIDGIAKPTRSQP